MKTYKEYLGESQLNEAKAPDVEMELYDVYSNLERTVKMLDNLHTSIVRAPKDSFENSGATKKVAKDIQVEVSNCLDNVTRLIKAGKSSGATYK
jgi:hypothetical protein